MSPKKVQLTLDDEAQATIAALQSLTGAESIAAVLRDALGVYSSLRTMLEGSQVLALVDRKSGTMGELKIPTLRVRSRVR